MNLSPRNHNFVLWKSMQGSRQTDDTVHWSVPVEIHSMPPKDWMDFVSFAASLLNVVLVIVGIGIGFWIWKKQQNRMKVSKTAEELLFALIDFQQVLGQARHIGHDGVGNKLPEVYQKRYDYLCSQHQVRTRLLVCGEKVKYVIPKINLFSVLNKLVSIWDDHLKYFNLLSSPDLAGAESIKHKEALNYFSKTDHGRNMFAVLSTQVEKANKDLTKYININ